MEKILRSFLTVHQVAEAVGGTIVGPEVSLQFELNGVGTDTRQDLQGQLFIALKGERYDAHDYIEQAVRAGARALLIHRESALSHLQTLIKEKSVAVICVHDTLLALAQLGLYWRKKWGGQILAVTGSSGKTTTKQILNKILASEKTTYVSPGSFNNHWGVPLTLLALRSNHQVGVVEMGMNHAHEIEQLVQIAEPNAVAVTMVGRAHLEAFGSIEGIAKAKEEIYTFAPPNSIRVFNYDNLWTRQMGLRSGGEHRAIWFGQDESANNISLDVMLQLKEDTADGLLVSGRIGSVHGKALVKLFGAHNITNILCAVSLAYAAGLKPERIWEALAGLSIETWGRNQWVELLNGKVRVLFDAYNANPESMAAAIDNFAKLRTSSASPKRLLAVVGEMLEMGSSKEEVHRELGRKLAQVDWDQIYFVGASGQFVGEGLQASGFQKNLVISDTYKDLLASPCRPMVHPGDFVLLKASRGIQLEKILEAWQDDEKKS